MPSHEGSGLGARSVFQRGPDRAVVERNATRVVSTESGPNLVFPFQKKGPGPENAFARRTKKQYGLCGILCELFFFVSDGECE